MAKKLHPCIFLDRDGVLNMVREDHVKSLKEFVWLPGVFLDMKRLQDAGYKLIVVTNQSAIGKGLTTNGKIRSIHRYMIAECAKHGITLTAIYWCPHTKEEKCDCRKPQPTMILTAAKDFEIDLESSYMIGDKDSDAEAGRAAHCKACIVLKHGQSLTAAVNIILGEV
jgi:histidinol-phosphate phosphatase family protein